MQLVYANPRPRKKARSAKQKAATARMIAARKKATKTRRRSAASTEGATMARQKRKATHRRRRVTVTANPRRRARRHSYRPTARRHNPIRRHHRRRNPASSGGGSLLKEFMSKEGLIMIAAGVAGATLPVMVQSRFLPNLTGYVKTAARAAVGLAGAWAVGKYVNRKAGLAFGVVALASSVSEVINTWQANSLVQSVGVTDQAVADKMAENPALMDGFLSLNGGYDATPMTGGYDAVPMGAAPYMDYADANAYESLN